VKISFTQISQIHGTIAEDIIENLEAGLESFREIMVKLNSK